MVPKRLIARLDIKGPNLIKGINLEGLRVIGNPNEFAIKYYAQGVDELIYMDCVASLYGRNSLVEIVKSVTTNVFVPITVGGGIRSVDDARLILRSGADKVALNTAAVQRPDLIRELAEEFGSQAVVVSIEAKRISDSLWEAYVDNGRERTGVNVRDWCEQAISLGAGEILLTSIDREGTRRGFDIDLVKYCSDKISIPVILSGGAGKPEHIVEALDMDVVDAVAFADIIHYGRYSLYEIRDLCLKNNISVRAHSNEI